MTYSDLQLAQRDQNDALARHDAALRQLFNLSLDPDLDIDNKIALLLKLGCDVLELPLGIVSRIEDSVYTVHYVNGPDWAPTTDTTFELSETYCSHTLIADDVKHFHHAGDSEIANHPCYLGFGLEGYIGVPLRNGTERVGTLNFSGPEERRPFTALEIEFVRLLGRWLGQEWLKSNKAQELAEKTMLLNAIIEAVPDAIIAAGDDRQIQMVNSATENLFGFDRDDLIGRTTSVLYPSLEEYERQGEHIYRKVKETTIGRFEMNLRKQDGSLFPGEVFMAPLMDEENMRLGLVGVIRDISNETALRRAKDELISTVSHELRTPITSAKGALKLLELERENLSAKMQKMLDAATRNVDRLVLLVENILDFERLNSNEFVSDLRNIDLSALVVRAVEDIHPFAAEHNVSVAAISNGAAASPIMGDENRLLQVLGSVDIQDSHLT